MLRIITYLLRTYYYFITFSLVLHNSVLRTVLTEARTVVAMGGGWQLVQPSKLQGWAASSSPRIPSLYGWVQDPARPSMIHPTNCDREEELTTQHRIHAMQCTPRLSTSLSSPVIPTNQLEINDPLPLLTPAFVVEDSRQSSKCARPLTNRFLEHQWLHAHQPTRRRDGPADVLRRILPAYLYLYLSVRVE